MCEIPQPEEVFAESRVFYYNDRWLELDQIDLNDTQELVGFFMLYLEEINPYFRRQIINYLVDRGLYSKESQEEFTKMQKAEGLHNLPIAQALTYLVQKEYKCVSDVFEVIRAKTEETVSLVKSKSLKVLSMVTDETLDGMMNADKLIEKYTRGKYITTWEEGRELLEDIIEGSKSALGDEILHHIQCFDRLKNFFVDPFESLRENRRLYAKYSEYGKITVYHDVSWGNIPLRYPKLENPHPPSSDDEDEKS